MAVIGHPQRLATLLTTLFQRGQRLLMRRFQARGSSSHSPSPVVLTYLLLLSGYTACQVFFAIQRKKDASTASRKFRRRLETGRGPLVGPGISTVERVVLGS